MRDRRFHRLQECAPSRPPQPFLSPIGGKAEYARARARLAQSLRAIVETVRAKHLALRKCEIHDTNSGYSEVSVRGCREP